MGSNLKDFPFLEKSSGTLNRKIVVACKEMIVYKKYSTSEPNSRLLRRNAIRRRNIKQIVLIISQNRIVPLASADQKIIRRKDDISKVAIIQNQQISTFEKQPNPDKKYNKCLKKTNSAEPMSNSYTNNSLFFTVLFQL